MSAARNLPSASARCSVGISLMVSPETEATVEYVRAQMPNAIIDFRDVFYKIERDGYLEFHLSEIASTWVTSSMRTASWSA